MLQLLSRFKTIYSSLHQFVLQSHILHLVCPIWVLVRVNRARYQFHLLFHLVLSFLKEQSRLEPRLPRGFNGRKLALFQIVVFSDQEIDFGVEGLDFLVKRLVFIAQSLLVLSVLLQAKNLLSESLFLRIGLLLYSQHLDRV